MHLEIGGVDKGGIGTGQKGDGRRHLRHFAQAAANVEAAPHRLPDGPLALGCLYKGKYLCKLCVNVQLVCDNLVIILSPLRDYVYKDSGSILS